MCVTAFQGIIQWNFCSFDLHQSFQATYERFVICNLFVNEEHAVFVDFHVSFLKSYRKKFELSIWQIYLVVSQDGQKVYFVSRLLSCRHHAGSVHCLFPIVTSLERSQKRVSCSKSAAGLLPFCHQADIRMRSHRLLLLDGNKSASSCQQACCKLIVKTFYPQAGGKLFDNSQQACKYQDATSLIFTDLLQLYEVNRLATTC